MLGSRGQKAVFEISEMRLLGPFSTTVRKDFVTQRSEFLSLRFVRITFVPQAEEDDGWLHSLVLLSCIHLAHHKKKFFSCILDVSNAVSRPRHFQLNVINEQFL